MEEKNDIFDQLKPRKMPVPDASYFENLANSIIDSQKEKTPEVSEKAKVIPLFKRPIFWIGSVAAVFIAGILIVNFTKTAESESDPLLALNDISSDEVYSYIDENIDDFDTDLIVEVMNETTVDEMSFVEEETTEASSAKKDAALVDPISFDDIDAQDILEYFNEEGIDSEDLEDEDSFI